MVLKAKAISYIEGKDSAPVVSAEGERLRAKELLAMARRYGIPVKTSEELIRRLEDCGASEELPEEMYLEMARVFKGLG